MIENDVFAVALIVGFAITGVHHLARCSQLWSTRSNAHGRAIELSGLLMSLAMIAMVPMWGSLGSMRVQVLVFGVFCGYFAFRVLALRFTKTESPSALTLGYHALATGAMVWMVAAMTPMTGHRWPSGETGHHGGHHGTSGAATVDPPLWMVSVTIVLAGALIAGAVVWFGAAVKANAAARTPGGRFSMARVTGPFVGSACHGLMSVGMGAMLLTML